MKNRILKIAKYTFALSLLVVVAAVLTGYIDMSWLFGGTLSLAVTAATVVQEPVTTTNNNPDLLKETISRNISKMHPDKYPFDTILRQMGVVVPVKSWKTSYFAVDTRPIEDTMAAEYDNSGTTDSPEWTAHTITPTSIFMWNKDDNILVQGVVGNDSKELMLHVVNITSTQLIIQAVNGIGDNLANLPVIANTTKLTRCGNSKEETASQTTPFSVLPQQDYNFNQIHMAQVEQSVYDKLHDKEANWDLNDMRSEAMWDMRGQMELTSLFGARRYLYDAVSKKYKYFSGGACRYITNNISKAKSGFDNSTFVDIGKTVFNDNNGSEQRIIFAGSGARATMAKAPTIQKQMEQRDVEVVWGVKFNRIETDFGSFLVKHHPLLNKAGWTDKAFILDMSNVEKHVFKGMATKTIDFDAQALRKTKGDIIDEAFCTVYKNLPTHSILEFTS